MISLNLDFEAKLVGQCYDGAANMSGCKNDLNVLIRKVAKKALYVHCYAHQLNLSLQHATESIQLASNCLSYINSLYSFISAKRNAQFQNIQDQDFLTTLKYLSQTRWASRSNALNAMDDTFSDVIKFLEQTCAMERGEAGAKAYGLLTVVKTFDFLFFVVVLACIFKKTNILHVSLQGLFFNEYIL